jgi:hypothetical protein
LRLRLVASRVVQPTVEPWFRERMTTLSTTLSEPVISLAERLVNEQSGSRLPSVSDARRRVVKASIGDHRLSDPFVRHD